MSITKSSGINIVDWLSLSIGAPRPPAVPFPFFFSSTTKKFLRIQTTA